MHPVGRGQSFDLHPKDQRMKCDTVEPLKCDTLDFFTNNAGISDIDHVNIMIDFPCVSH